MRPTSQTDESTTEETTTRRGLLQAGGAALAAGIAGSSAGCLSLLPPVGQQVRYGRVDVPAPTNTDPVYRKWLPATSELPDLEHTDSAADINWMYVTPGNLGREQLGGEFRIGIDVVQSGLSYFGTPLSAHDHLVGVGSLGGVVESKVDRDHAGSVLVEGGFQPAGSYQGYDLFDRTDKPRLVAVADDAVVQSRGDRRREKAETLIDAGDGRIERHHETDADFATFSEWVGAYPTIMEGFPPALVDATVEESAMVYTFDEQAGYFINKYLYQEGETPTKQAIKQRLNEDVNRAMQAWSVDIKIEEPRVTVQMRVEQDQFGSDFDDESLPFVTWGVEESDETITVRHEAGESIPVDNLEISPREALQDPPAAGTTLEAGDALSFDRETVVAARSEDSYNDIEVVYHFGEHSTAMLFSHTLDANDSTT